MKSTSQMTIVKDENYNSFPSVARMADGRLIMVFRRADNSLKKHGAVTHVDPSSRVAAVFSADDGETWSAPRDIYDDEMGEQDPCVTRLANGTLICTFFRWRVVPIERKELLGEDYAYIGRDIFNKWSAVHVGTMCIRSADNGATWDGPWRMDPRGFQCPAALRGNVVECEDGGLLAPLYACKRRGGLAQVLLLRSADKGRTWTHWGEAPGSPRKNFLEPFLYQAPSGRLDLFMRTQTDFRRHEFDGTYRRLHVSSSLDGGRRWSRPRATGLFCPNPVHVLPLGDGRVIMSYGQRRAPKGIKVVVTDAERLRVNDARSAYARTTEDADLGYTSAVLRGDGRVLLVYYMTDTEGSACIAATILEVE